MLLFNALLALAELTNAFVSRPILLKHKSFSFYRPSAYGEYPHREMIVALLIFTSYCSSCS